MAYCHQVSGWERFHFDARKSASMRSLAAKTKQPLADLRL
jgi:hypothetical protein